MVQSSCHPGISDDQEMIKVRHSKSRHALILELSGEIGANEAEAAKHKVARVLEELGRGYTLIEAFRGGAKISRDAMLRVADLVSACYTGSRIWRVVRIFMDGASDPGLCILHRTRWTRSVPESEADGARQAVALAEEEARENSEWLVMQGA